MKVKFCVFLNMKSSFAFLIEPVAPCAVDLQCQILQLCLWFKRAFCNFMKNFANSQIQTKCTYFSYLLCPASRWLSLWRSESELSRFWQPTRDEHGNGQHKHEGLKRWCSCSSKVPSLKCSGASGKGSYCAPSFSVPLPTWLHREEEEVLC